jgi:hypothetical protein
MKREVSFVDSREWLPPKKPAASSRPDFHIPHPLDYDWRFTSSTTAYLWEMARQLAASSERIILLGTPSLAEHAKRRPIWQGPVTLLDQNVVVPTPADGSVQEIRCDILVAPPPRWTASLVIADPPWYEMESQGFLWYSACACRVGGFVAMSIPPLRTRPGVENERIRLNAVAAKCGLQPFGIFENVLGYETPFFEVNAIRSSGVCASFDWRRGDLAIFQRMEQTLEQRPAVSVRPSWSEHKIGNTRFRLKQKPCESIILSPVLGSVVPGDILPTISRRDPRREFVDVWTSGNRIFQCGNTAILSVVIDAILSRRSATSMVSSHVGRDLTEPENHSVEVASRQLLEIVKCEDVELQQHNDDLRATYRLGPRPYQPAALERAG